MGIILFILQIAGAWYLFWSLVATISPSRALTGQEAFWGKLWVLVGRLADRLGMKLKRDK